jgi:hypothetical protein
MFKDSRNTGTGGDSGRAGSEGDSKKPRLIIFDDLVALDKVEQAKISQYFIAGRKLGLSCIYISQAYYGIPKLVRLQCDWILLKSIGSPRDVKAILRENGENLDEVKLKRYYHASMKNKMDFLLLDTNNGVAYKNFFEPFEYTNGVKELKAIPAGKVVQSAFLDELKQALRGSAFSASDLYQAYRTWSEQQGYIPVSPVLFGRNMMKEADDEEWIRRRKYGSIVFYEII